MPAVPGIPDRLFLAVAVGNTSLAEFAAWCAKEFQPWAQMIAAFAEGAEEFDQQLGTVWPHEMTGGAAQRQAFDKVLEQAFRVWNGEQTPGKEPRYYGMGKLRREPGAESGAVDVYQKVTRNDLFSALCLGAVAIDKGAATDAKPPRLIIRNDPNGRAFLFYMREGKLVPAGKYVMDEPPPIRRREKPPEVSLSPQEVERDRIATEEADERMRVLAEKRRIRAAIMQRMEQVESVEELERLQKQLG